MFSDQAYKEHKNDDRFLELWNRAVAAGLAAGNKTVPIPMNVIGGPPGETPKIYHVADGMCGFAWIVIKPGNCPLANWLKATGRATLHYGGGVNIWISDYNQSVARKEDHAHAMAQVFVDAGYRAYADSRLD